MYLLISDLRLSALICHLKSSALQLYCNGRNFQHNLVFWYRKLHTLCIESFFLTT